MDGFGIVEVAACLLRTSFAVECFVVSDFQFSFVCGKSSNLLI